MDANKANNNYKNQKCIDFFLPSLTGFIIVLLDFLHKLMPGVIDSVWQEPITCPRCEVLKFRLRSDLDCAMPSRIWKVYLQFEVSCYHLLNLHDAADKTTFRPSVPREPGGWNGRQSRAISAYPSYQQAYTHLHSFVGLRAVISCVVSGTLLYNHYIVNSPASARNKILYILGNVGKSHMNPHSVDFCWRSLQNWIAVVAVFAWFRIRTTELRGGWERRNCKYELSRCC